MKLMIIAPRMLLCALLISAGGIATAHAAETPGKEHNGESMGCEMKFNLRGMPGFYETAKGEGIITCNNGQIAQLSIRVTGGMRFGRSEFVEGNGRFSDARTIDELFGSYVPSEVHAVASDSAGVVQVLTKGRISLALAGTDRNMEFGFAFEKFTIERAN